MPGLIKNAVIGDFTKIVVCLVVGSVVRTRRACQVPGSRVRAMQSTRKILFVLHNLLSQLGP